MRIYQRNYRGQFFRPSPEIHQDESVDLCMIVTPWGSREGARTVIQTFTDYFASAFNDREVTSPFPRQACLSLLANNLRTAMLLANDALLREYNDEEYTNAIEAIAIARFENEVAWVQVGQPSLLLSRKNKGLISIAPSFDNSSNLSLSDSELAPMPSDILGVDRSVNIIIQSLRPQYEDKLLLVSHSWLPQEIYSAPELNSERDLDQILKKLAHQNEVQAFWIALLDLEINEKEEILLPED